jgi:hypothetical protein
MCGTVDTQGQSARDDEASARELMDKPCGVVESAPTRPASPHKGYLGP